MEEVTDGLGRFVERVMEWLPAFVGALIILIAGYFVAKVLANLTRKGLIALRLDPRLHAGHGGNIIQRAVPSPTDLIKSVVFWAVFIGAISLAVSVLGIPALTAFVAAIYGYLPRVLAALLIFLAAGAVSAAVSTLVGSTMGDTPTGKVIMTAIPVVVMGIATFMILNQLGIAPEIVTITYAAIMGSVALGLALAFGLGGRDVAHKLLSDAYSNVQAQRPHIKHDLEKGKAETVRASENIRRRAM